MTDRETLCETIFRVRYFRFDCFFHGVSVSSITERMFPAGSLNQANGRAIASHDSFLVRLEVRRKPDA